ncbi:regulator of (H+)-ATPase in vacuolar membrane [Extremus antarcticus]|uniref:Regulator of (H+)-ATPase in vacuolar membrane n=1 Tax=Extremus antarcticus TaxID=702011 RepID=A0AAJ0GG70_9PEZI|nr:regulator of (H+)-ATPase in vacuolar membrane [Extremus antarcticus]
MPSTSPGNDTPSDFVQILPGAPTTSLQTLSTFSFRHKRYIAYFSGRQLNFLTSPTILVQALTFPDPPIAIASEPHTGKVAVASKKDVWVLEPHTEGWTKVWWVKTLFLVRQDAGDEAKCLSWGSAGEVLVGGSKLLCLFSTLPSSRTSSPADETAGAENLEERRMLWSKDVSSAVQHAAFSPSAELIATCGVYDRLVKIWRRLSFEHGLFDYTYIPHPGTVTHLEWRPLDTQSGSPSESGMTGRYEDDPEILYTIATDGLLRIWRTGGLHDLDMLLLYTTVDLNSAMPNSPSLIANEDASPQNKAARYAITIPSEQFCDAVTAAIGLPTEKISHSLEHLKETASKEPDVAITLDGHGRMSAWGVQSIGHKRRPETPTGWSKRAFHIAHAEGLPMRMEDGTNARFEAWFEDAMLNVLVHHFGGAVQWWSGDVESFFSPSAAGGDRVRELAWWGGHSSGPISTLLGASEGRDILSCDNCGNVLSLTAATTGPHERSRYTLEGRILDLAVFADVNDRGGHFAALLHSPSDPCELEVVLRHRGGKVLGRLPYVLEPENDGATWSLSASGNSEKTVIVALSSNGRGSGCTLNTTQPAVLHLMQFSLPAPESGNGILHTAAVLDADHVDKVGLVCVDKTGALLLYHMDIDDRGTLDPALIATFESVVPNPSILAASNEFAAVASSTGDELAIVNLRDGYVEHRHATGGQIRHIVPAPKHHLVAIGYDTEVQILAQGRYEHHGDMPAWILLKRISIAGMGLTITALTWLGDGSVALAAGTCIFISSGHVPMQELHKDVQEAIDAKLESWKSHELTSLSHRLKKPLPVWHPIRHGHWELASSLLHNLVHKLKFWSEGDDLHPLLDVPAEHVYGSERAPIAGTLDQDLADELMQQLEEKDLPEVSQTEQERLKRVVQAMAYCSTHVSALDNGALRYLFNWKLGILHMKAALALPTGQPNGVLLPNTPEVPIMHWREIAFAHHSSTQQPLLDILIAHYDDRITWPIARRLGLFAWLSDRYALEQIFDSLAQSAYRSSSPPDPINASLFFLAMHKKPALLALWRIATWHREQRATMAFLRRDFGIAGNKTAAKKNAYALMGKKRFDYAAAFFLLAEDAASATSVLASQCEDTMLAIAVARLYAGDGSALLRKLVEDRVMPQASKDGDRWAMSWCHSILLQQDEAAEALVMPLEGVVRRWEQDDPGTMALYAAVRKGEGSEWEYEAVLRAARVLRRMGLWLLALEMVARWEFKTPRVMRPLPTREIEGTNGVGQVNGIAEAPSMLDAFADDASTGTKAAPSMLDAFEPPTPTTAAAPVVEKTAREAKAAELLKKMKVKKEAAQPAAMNEKKPEPTQFKEPDANSLLDSFGF